MDEWQAMIHDGHLYFFKPKVPDWMERMFLRIERELTKAEREAEGNGSGDMG